MNDFHGVKVALLDGDKMLVYLRDNKPGLRFAGLWDFFGGGRENQETPFECARRELQEELCIELLPEQIVFERVFLAMHDPAQNAYFMVANLSDENIKGLQFGSEGQEHAFVAIDEFMNRGDFVPFLLPRFESYLQSVK